MRHVIRLTQIHNLRDPPRPTDDSEPELPLAKYYNRLAVVFERFQENSLKIIGVHIHTKWFVHMLHGCQWRRQWKNVGIKRTASTTS